MYGVFVGGLGSSSEQEVRDVFEQFGTIESVKIIREGVGQPKGYGFVNFCNEESQKNALSHREEIRVNGSTWFVRKGHTSVAKDQLMCLQVTGFPETWNKQKIKIYVAQQTGLEVLNVGQQGLKTCFSFRRSEVQKAVQALNGSSVEGHQITVESATPKVHRQNNITFATVLYELALANGITPLLDQQQFYLLEKSLRTLYVGNIAQEVTELEIASCFRDYGSLEDVSLVLNLETGEHRGFAFVVFDSHQTCEEVLAAEKFHSINGNIVKVQSSKPPKAVAELAKQAGLNDMEGHRTPLLEQMLSAARQQVEIMNAAKKNAAAQRNVRPMPTFVTAAPAQTYVQDPNTGQVYLMPIPSYSAAAFPKQQLQSHLSAVPRMPNMIHSTIRAPQYFPLQQAGFTNQQMFMQPQLSNVAAQSFNTALMSCMPSQVSPLVSMQSPMAPIMNQLTPALSPTSFTTPPLLQQFSTQPQQQQQQQQNQHQQQSQTPLTQQPLTQTSITQTSITQTPITQPQMTQPQSNIQKPPIMTPKLSNSTRYAPY
jgi:RNA recognition motif-containing protein